MDGAEARPAGAEAVNVGGTRNVAGFGAPVVYYSTDYVFDGRKAEPYVESDEPRPLSVYGRTKLTGEREIECGWIVRSSWLFGGAGHNFVRTMLRLGGERDEVAVVDDQRGCPTYVGHLAEATRDVLELPEGVWHLAADGECTWSSSRRRSSRRLAYGAATADLLGGARPACAEACLLGPAQRAARRAAAPALARRPTSLPGPTLSAPARSAGGRAPRRTPCARSLTGRRSRETSDVGSRKMIAGTMLEEHEGEAVHGHRRGRAQARHQLVVMNASATQEMKIGLVTTAFIASRSAAGRRRVCPSRSPSRHCFGAAQELSSTSRRAFTGAPTVAAARVPDTARGATSNSWAGAQPSSARIFDESSR